VFDEVVINLPPSLTGDISGDRCVYMWGPYDGAYGRFACYDKAKHVDAGYGGRASVYRACILDGHPVRDDRDNVILYFEEYAT
jgi:hypothetical protein